MPQCKHYNICGRDGGEGIEEDLCILHSKSPDKDDQAFSTAFDTHRKERGDNFSFFTFPGEIYFTGATFSGEANFSGATFSMGVYFSGATFSGEANFSGATFSMGASFDSVKFGEVILFFGAKFLGRTLFTARQKEHGVAVLIFSDTTVDFREVLIEPLEALVLRDADLQRCRFLDTDLRKAEITGVVWPQIGGRFCVYDEKILVLLQDRFWGIARFFPFPLAGKRTSFPKRFPEDALEKGKSWPWSRLERLYRELKQNYEDRRDYERAGDFHYGEKEMRRKNPDTSLSLRFFLTLYWVVSGYGERYLRPLAWAAALLFVSTISYLWLGLEGKWTGDRTAILSMSSVGDWLQAAHYSFRAMTFLKPEDVATPMGYSRAVHTAQSLLGPLFLGLFALAVRQRLKR